MTLRRALPYVDTHAAGEASRVITGNELLAQGTTMADKLGYAQAHLDWLRQLVLHEPRGCPSWCGVLVTAPCDPRADAGILVMEQAGWRPMSGSNTMCTVTALLETGVIPGNGPTKHLTLDTAVGLVEVDAAVENGKVTSVSILNVPSYVNVLDYPLKVHELGQVSVDVVFGGQFFAQARATDLGLELVPENAPAITRAGALIRAAAREQIPVQHPDNPDIATIDLVMVHGDSPTHDAGGRNAVICVNGEVDYDRPETWTGSIDRSPCGTGTCGRMAAKHARGELALGESFIHESLIGSRFVGHLVEEVEGSVQHAVRPIITGPAWVTGMGKILLDDSDPFPHGYTVADIWAS